MTCITIHVVIFSVNFLKSLSTIFDQNFKISCIKYKVYIDINSNWYFEKPSYCDFFLSFDFLSYWAYNYWSHTFSIIWKTIRLKLSEKFHFDHTNVLAHNLIIFSKTINRIFTKLGKKKFLDISILSEWHPKDPKQCGFAIKGMYEKGDKIKSSPQQALKSENRVNRLWVAITKA